MYAYSPKGTAIIGTSEIVLARAEISEGSFERQADGSLNFDHAGDSEMFWDTMETQTRNGKIVFLDDDGNEWTEDQLILCEDDDEYNARFPDPNTDSALFVKGAA